MRLKILTPSEYEKIKDTSGCLIVSELDKIRMFYHVVVVEYLNGIYKVISWPKQIEEKVPLLITKEDLYKLIFMCGI